MSHEVSFILTSKSNNCHSIHYLRFFLSDDVIPMTSSVDVGKRKSDGIFGVMMLRCDDYSLNLTEEQWDLGTSFVFFLRSATSDGRKYVCVRRLPSDMRKWIFTAESQILQLSLLNVVV